MLAVTHLNGFNVVQGDDLGLTTISLFGSATSTAETITAPDNINAGDLIVLVDAAENNNNGSPPTEVVPTDFSSLGSEVISETRQIFSWKMADGTEGGTSITGMNANTQNKKALFVFRGNVAATTITPTTPNSQMTNGNPSSQSVLASGGTAPRVIVAAYANSSLQVAVDPRTFSPTEDGEINPTTHLYMKYLIQNVTLADATIDMDDEGFRSGLQSVGFDMA